MNYSLGAWSLAGLLFASIVGTGVFTTSGLALAQVGSAHAVMWAWVLGAVYALLGVTVYWRVAKQIGDTGGEYALVQKALHPVLGFFCGMISLFSGFAGPIAVSALALDKYVKPGVGPAILIGHFVLLLWSTKASLWTQNTAVYFRLAALVGCIVIAAIYIPGLSGASSLAGDGSSASGEFAGWSAFTNSFVWVLFSYSGWSSFAYVWGRFNPFAKATKFAIGGAVAVVASLYLILNYIFLFIIPRERIIGQENLVAIATNFVAGPEAANWTAALVVMGFATSMGALIFMGTQVVSRFLLDWTPWSADRRDVMAQWALGILAVGLYMNASIADALGLIGYLLCLCNVFVGISVYRIKASCDALSQWVLVPTFILLSLVASLLPLFSDAKAALFCGLFAFISLATGALLHTRGLRQKRVHSQL
jgi:amino acid transporter